MKCVQWIAIYGDHAVNHQGRMREREREREMEGKRGMHAINEAEVSYGICSHHIS